MLYLYKKVPVWGVRRLRDSLQSRGKWNASWPWLVLTCCRALHFGLSVGCVSLSSSRGAKSPKPAPFQNPSWSKPMPEFLATLQQLEQNEDCDAIALTPKIQRADWLLTCTIFITLGPAVFHVQRDSKDLWLVKEDTPTTIIYSGSIYVFRRI